MKEKRKAEELTHKFYEIENDSQYFGVNWKVAKKCAIIAVDELIESHLLLTTTHDTKPSIRCKRYWQEVKQEIEKL
jgi:hypothetical protein